jgi:hypothetical protein
MEKVSRDKIAHAIIKVGRNSSSRVGNGIKPPQTSVSEIGLETRGAQDTPCCLGDTRGRTFKLLSP